MQHTIYCTPLMQQTHKCNKQRNNEYREPRKTWWLSFGNVLRQRRHLPMYECCNVPRAKKQQTNTITQSNSYHKMEHVRPQTSLSAQMHHYRLAQLFEFSLKPSSHCYNGHIASVLQLYSMNATQTNLHNLHNARNKQTNNAEIVQLKMWQCI